MRGTRGPAKGQSQRESMRIRDTDNNDANRVFRIVTRYANKMPLISRLACHLLNSFLSNEITATKCFRKNFHAVILFVKF